MSTEHSLHKAVGSILIELEEIQFVLDTACGGDHNIPLFGSDERSRGSKLCNVDAVILRDEEIQVIFEIEEANIKPTQICGKLLTSALSTRYEYKGDKYMMSNKVVFVQVLDSSKLRDKTSKIQQFNMIEEMLNRILPVGESRIMEYKLFHGETGDFEFGKTRVEMTDYLRGVLK